MNFFRLLATSIISVIIPIETIASEANDSIVCNIFGKVINRPNSKNAIIIEYAKDRRVNDYITVPIVNGSFSLTLRDSVPLKYTVMFNDEIEHGSWKLRPFIIGNGDITIECYGEENDDSTTIVSELEDNILESRRRSIFEKEFGNEYRGLEDQLNELFKTGDAYNADLKRLFIEDENTPEGEKKDSLELLIREQFKLPRNEQHSEQFNNIENQLVKILQKEDSINRSIIAEKPSIYGLAEIRDVLKLMQDDERKDIGDYIAIFESTYLEPMASHPYTAQILTAIESMKVKAGNKYPDFKVTRADGSTEKISSLIKGKTAVINLWASWCGPCRRHSIELIPLYNRYKDSGFTVVAIARESDDCTAMESAMKRDGYPWDSFVDLNDRDGVWELNGASTTAGKIILVDANGIIVGVNLPAEEIAAYLEKASGK